VPYLYYLSLHASDAGGHRSADVLFKIGLRTLAVAAGAGRPAAGPAHRLAFAVNGRRLLASGVDFSPVVPSIAAIARSPLRDALGALLATGVNLVRVGGDGRGPAAAYDCCDELGLLVWQDLTGAGSAAAPPRPRDDQAALARAQVRHLAWRPALALVQAPAVRTAAPPRRGSA
jgi:beta-galactosidase/beta-glucuronidase